MQLVIIFWHCQFYGAFVYVSANFRTSILSSMFIFSPSAERLSAELTAINLNLPARVWIPFSRTTAHHVVRIPYTQAVVLNSKEKAPFMVYIEVLECENAVTCPVPRKLLENSLRFVQEASELSFVWEALKKGIKQNKSIFYTCL